jgi:hypothetical protein
VQHARVVVAPYVGTASLRRRTGMARTASVAASPCVTAPACAAAATAATHMHNPAAAIRRSEFISTLPVCRSGLLKDTTRVSQSEMPLKRTGRPAVGD